MKSNKGLTLTWIFVIIIAMCFVIGVSVYVIMGSKDFKDYNNKETEPVITNEVEV